MASGDANEPVDLTVQRVDVVCDAFESEWKRGRRPRIEEFLDESVNHGILLRELLAIEFDYLRRSSEHPELNDYHARFPNHVAVIDELFVEDSTASPAAGGSTDTLRMTGTEKLDSFGKTRSGGTVFADYELLEEIARGGMGVVYRAVQTSVNRVVALKMILSGQLASEEEVRRFRSEAEAAALLDHPNIVPVFDVGEYDGRHFFSMGYVDGDSLSDRLRDGPLPLSEAAQLVRSIADALQCAHRNGVIHRDLKPSNVLIDHDGTPRVTDFGLARRLESENNLTATGQVMGTPSYMPPEQATGDMSRIGVQSDVYSLGAILYSLVTGRPPFQAAHVVETLRQVIDDQPVEPRILNSSVDRDLETICLKCLAKEPRQRYQRAEELVAELDRYLDGKPIVARSITGRERLWRWCRRNRLIAGLAAVAVSSLLVGTGVSIYFAVLADRRANEAEAGVRVALTALESAINKIQHELRFIPAAQEVRRDLLREAMVSLQNVSGQVQTQSRVDRNTANALVDLGKLFVELGDDEGLNSLVPAESNFRAAVRIYRQIVSPDETDTELLRDQSWALSECGSFLLDRNQLNDAAELLQEALSIRRRLLRQSPDDPGHQYRVSLSLTDWADLVTLRGDFTGAIGFLQEALELAENASASDPDHPLLRGHIVQCNEKLGDAYHDLQENDRALTYFQTSLRMTIADQERDPESAEIWNSLSFCQERLGNHWLQTGDAVQALEMYVKMRQSVEQAIERDPRNRLLREGLAFSYSKIGAAHHALRQHGEAARAENEAAKIRRELGVP